MQSGHKVLQPLLTDALQATFLAFYNLHLSEVLLAAATIQHARVSCSLPYIRWIHLQQEQAGSLL